MESVKTTSPGKVGLTYGIYLGLILVIIQVVMYVTGMALEGVQWPIYIYYLIFPVLVILSIHAFKKNNNGYLSLSEALKAGIVTAVISGIIFLIYNLLLVYIIDPGYIELALERARENMAEAGNLTEEQMDAGMQWVESLTNPLMGGAIWLAMSALFGLIYSLIGGATMKNDKP